MDTIPNNTQSKWLNKWRIFLFISCVFLAVVTFYVKNHLQSESDKTLVPQKINVKQLRELKNSQNDVQGSKTNSATNQHKSDTAIGKFKDIPVKNQIPTSFYDPEYKPGEGLETFLYNTAKLTDLKLKKITPTVSISLTNSQTPDKTITSQEFSIRWEGQILIPQTKDTSFFVSGDNAITKLWIDDRQLIFSQLHQNEVETEIFLTEGQRYDIKIEALKAKKDASFKFELLWNANGTKEPIPTKNLFAYKQPALIDIIFADTNQTYGLKVARSGMYYPWIKAYTNTKSSDTLLLKIDGKKYLVDLPSTSNQWLWLRPSLIEETSQNKVATAYIARGERVLEVQKLEPLLKIERIIFTDGAEYKPK